MNIKGINKAEILRRLYNASKPQGYGILQFTPEDMTLDLAEDLLKESTNFDYLQGRVMKIDLKDDELQTYMYNRDNGKNAAEKIIEDIEVDQKA